MPARLRRTLTAEGVYLAASLAAAASLALIAWGLIGSLPSVNAAALDRWPDFLLKGWTPLHLSHLFEARHLVLGFALALGFAGRLPSRAGRHRRNALPSHVQGRGVRGVGAI